MAHDPSPPRRELSAASIARLESALGAFLAAPSDGKSLDTALRAVTSEARDNQVQAEQLLVVLKDIWFGLPAIKSAPTGEHHNALLQRAVTQCIREYYSA